MDYAHWLLILKAYLTVQTEQEQHDEKQDRPQGSQRHLGNSFWINYESKSRTWLKKKCRSDERKKIKRCEWTSASKFPRKRKGDLEITLYHRRESANFTPSLARVSSHVSVLCVIKQVAFSASPPPTKSKQWNLKPDITWWTSLCQLYEMPMMHYFIPCSWDIQAWPVKHVKHASNSHRSLVITTKEVVKIEVSPLSPLLNRGHK